MALTVARTGNHGSHITVTDSSDSRTSLIGSCHKSRPIGTRLFGSCFSFSSLQRKRTFHKGLVLVLTYIAYAAFHMGRRPLSIVKNELNHNCTYVPKNGTSDNDEDPNLVVSQFHHYNLFSFNNQNNQNTLNISLITPINTQNVHNDTSCDHPNWAPFDDNSTANQLLAILDTSFLLSYAIFMFFSGIIAERTDLRHFISVGCTLSGLGLIAFGIARPFEIHSLSYFIIVQVLSGAAQTTGWPVAVTCVSNWFEPAKRGLIYGLWNSHTNVGNIIGATVAGFFVEKDWALSFIVPGFIMIFVAILLFLFLVPTPYDVGLSNQQKDDSEIKCSSSSSSVTTDYGRIEDGARVNTVIQNSDEDHKAVSFLTALKIPGVIEYSMCLFFSKLVSYTFLYWLPRYITSSTSNSSEYSAYLSTPFDIGGIVGAILAGYLCDRYKASGITCNVMLLLAIPSIIAYQNFGATSTIHNISLQLLVGCFVNGPYCLITTAVSADLGNRVKSGKAMATVAAIIDGAGSVGAAIGPLFGGYISNSGDWRKVFLMLILSNIFASLCLIRVTLGEIKRKFFNSTRNHEQC